MPVFIRDFDRRLAWNIELHGAPYEVAQLNPSEAALLGLNGHDQDNGQALDEAEQLLIKAGRQLITANEKAQTQLQKLSENPEG